MGKTVPNGLLQVGEEQTALFDAHNNGSEVVIKKDDIAGLLGHVAAILAHGDPDGGLLEGGRVVDSVAGHGSDIARLGELQMDMGKRNYIY